MSVAPRRNYIQLFISGFLVIIMALAASMVLYAPPIGHAAFQSLNSKVVFSTTRNGSLDIYAINADGSDQIQITNHPANEYDAVWSPDGMKIAFASDRTGFNEVYLMN